jgi:hypothetical protein
MNKFVKTRILFIRENAGQTGCSIQSLEKPAQTIL